MINYKQLLIGSPLPSEITSFEVLIHPNTFVTIEEGAIALQWFHDIKVYLKTEKISL